MSHHETFLAFIRGHASSDERYHASGEYTGGNHIHYGLTAPLMRNFMKDWCSDHKNDLSYQGWETLLHNLYHGHSFEERAMAGMVMSRFPKSRPQLPFATLDEWLGQLVGWAEVDSTCGLVFEAKDFTGRWDEWEPFLRQLADDPNINKRRASLVFPIRPIRGSKDKRFFELGLAVVDALKHEKDKLITKAVSWILRESIKQHRVDVGQYVSENADSLPAIAVREFRTKFETGTK